VVPIARLGRIRTLIKALGGARKVAGMLLKAKTLAQFLTIGGPELAELGMLLFNFQGVFIHCFSWL
jgi:hypothetical protein